MLKKNLIKEALQRKESEDRVGDIQITKEALEKAHMYAKKIREVHGEDLECYFFLISPIIKNDRIVRDVYFPNQEVTHAAVRIDANGIIETGRILREKGFKILGWAHSHASFHTFHSHTDDENHVNVLNEISSDNYVEIKNEREMFKFPETSIDKGTVYISDKAKNVTLILDIDGNFKGNVLNSKISGPIRVGFAYSLVVNSDEKLKPHCEIAIKEFCPLYLRQKEIETYKVPIKIIENEEYKAKIDVTTILEEIKEKVKEVSPWGYFGEGYKKGSYYDEETGDGVYTKEEVDRMLEDQRMELEDVHQQDVSNILKEIWKASLFGRMWKVMKKILKSRNVEVAPKGDYIEIPLPQDKPKPKVEIRPPKKPTGKYDNTKTDK